MKADNVLFSCLFAFLALTIYKKHYRGRRKGGPKTAQKYAKKPQTASDFFPNTKTAHPLRFHLRPQRPQLPLSRIESKQREHEAVQLYD